MGRLFLTFSILINFAFATGCGGVHGEEYRGREVASREDTPANRNIRIERIFPEDANFTSRRLGALIEAIETVRPDIPKAELPRVGDAVRHVMREMSVRDLDRVEAILPRIIEKRQAEGVE